MKKDIIIVIIEDNETLKTGGLIWELEDLFNIIKFFTKPDEGIKFIQENINNQIIVLLDISFPTNEKNGHRVLELIKNLSQNIPVILWSGINEYEEPFSDFINNNADAFLNKDATTEEALSIINKTVNSLQFNLDNIVENWINQHPENEKDKPVYISSEDKSYSLNDILNEMRMQTETGKDFSKRLTKLTIDLLMRNKESLND